MGSAEVTPGYSSSPSAVPSKVRVYRSRTRWARGWKSGSVMKIQEWCCHGLSASVLSQRRTVEADRKVTMPRVTASRASSGHDPARKRHSALGRQPAGQCLHLDRLQGRERRRAAGSLTVPEPGKSLLGEAAPASAHRVEVQIRLPRDVGIGTAVRGVQHDLRPHPLPVLALVAPGHLLQPLAIGGGQKYRTGDGNRHGRRANREKRITVGGGLPHPRAGTPHALLRGSGRMAAMAAPPDSSRVSGAWRTAR
ncbi:hypothetical protein EDD95_4871 [Streptomyces sp. CEV 2-1]|nr:hypothetical protein EDD95_4871 [Streptomyces sp. CEV 2-1]